MLTHFGTKRFKEGYRATILIQFCPEIGGSLFFIFESGSGASS